jgi:hypothetical protein
VHALASSPPSPLPLLDAEVVPPLELEPLSGGIATPAAPLSVALPASTRFSSPGVYVGSVASAIRFGPHIPVCGWQLSSELEQTLPTQSAASTMRSSATRLVGTWTCTTRWTTALPSLSAVTVMSAS